jgi:hypothetical protein
MPHTPKLSSGLYPFWFWNGTLQESEISRQLELFKSSGCKGVVIHCRVGNAIAYMSDRWLELCRFAAVTARNHGLKIWLYDEAGFPSGNAGEMVQRHRPDLYQKYMHFEYSGTDPLKPAYQAFIPGSAKKLDERQAPPGSLALRFFLVENGRHVDMFSRDACNLFIAHTHKRYKDALGDLFGDPIQAIYTDDESWTMCRFQGLAWSPVLERDYRAKYGHDLSDLLPLLVEDLPGFEQARMTYRSLAETTFLRNFVQPQRDWCSVNQLLYTGHLCGDEGPLATIIDRFGAPMPYLKLEDIPAIDDFLCDLSNQRYLGQRLAGSEDRYLSCSEPVRSPLMVYKYASSIAHQFKNDWLSCECLTFLGWNRPTAFMDLQMSFEIGMGVNLITPHAFYYSIGGVAKNDCPPSYFFHQPGFNHFHEMFANWTHSAELLRRGTFHGDCLLLLPAGSWYYQRGNDIIADFTHKLAPTIASTAQIEEALSTATFDLMRRHIGFDYGDERIVNAEAKLNNGQLWLGQHAYSTIILPVDIELLPETANILAEFEALGGSVIHGTDFSALESDLDMSGYATEEILVHARNNAGFRELYMVNLSGHDVEPKLNLAGVFKLYNPRTRLALKCRDRLPKGAVFPAGMAAFILPETFECELESFEHSLFAPAADRLLATFVEAHPLDENIACIGANEIKEFNLPAGVGINHVYTEQLGDLALQINCRPLVDSGPLHHPIDPCYRGIKTTDLFRLGYNHIEGIEKPVYLAGNFQVESLNPVAFCSKPIRLGDLTKQGFPCYWGKFEYNFTFAGPAKFVELELNGSAEIWLNNHYVETCFAAIRKTSIARFCNRTKNKLTLILMNTPQNFIGPEHPAFGIENCTIVR